MTHQLGGRTQRKNPRGRALHFSFFSRGPARVTDSAPELHHHTHTRGDSQAYGGKRARIGTYTNTSDLCDKRPTDDGNSEGFNRTKSIKKAEGNRQRKRPLTRAQTSTGMAHAPGGAIHAPEPQLLARNSSQPYHLRPSTSFLHHLMSI